jgi:hypothetical protein
MCDLTPVRNWLTATAAAIFTAAGIITGAARPSDSWWHAWITPFAMLAAAGASALAAACCSRAVAALDAFCVCGRARCAGPRGSLRRRLATAGPVLGLAAAAAAWIPVAGRTALWMVVAVLLAQAVLILAWERRARLLWAEAAAAPGPPTAFRMEMNGD